MDILGGKHYECLIQGQSQTELLFQKHVVRGTEYSVIFGRRGQEIGGKYYETIDTLNYVV